MFPISRDPPEGGTVKIVLFRELVHHKFPISRDPPEGGTRIRAWDHRADWFPISRDPPEGGTV